MKLILLYGKISKESHPKQQMMIEGKTTCGYREYAKNYGCIIYLCPQKVSKSWEFSIPNPQKVIEFIKKYPEAVVWSIKRQKEKDQRILSQIPNKKIYYSCNSKNRYNKICDRSLVDTEERLRSNAILHIKGKDTNFWVPTGVEKIYDYLLMGRRADKNEIYFINALGVIKETRNILWIGGEKHAGKFRTHHNVTFTPFIGPEKIRLLIPQAKVGILYTDHPAEGFPQTVLEMTMCGVPVVYNKNAPRNKHYFSKATCSMADKKTNIIYCAEKLLQRYDPAACRKFAVENYSLEISFQNMVRGL